VFDWIGGKVVSVHTVSSCSSDVTHHPHPLRRQHGQTRPLAIGCFDPFLQIDDMHGHHPSSLSITTIDYILHNNIRILDRGRGQGSFPSDTVSAMLCLARPKVGVD
jgi:hypothetical protein